VQRPETEHRTQNKTNCSTPAPKPISITPSVAVAVTVTMGSHRDFFLHDPFFPPPPSKFFSSSSSCPFLLDLDCPFPFPAGDLDLFLPPTAPPIDPTPFLLRDLTDRVAALELAVRPQPASRKYTYVTESAGRKVKWTAVDRRGERDLKWEAEIKSPNDDGFDRKWKWESKGGSSSAAARKVKWGASVKGKGCLQPWSQSYTWEEDFATSDDDQEEEEEPTPPKPITDKKKKKPANKVKKCPASTTIKIEEIPDDNDAGCAAIRKVSLSLYFSPLLPP
jgi:hypothetical protein